MSTPLTRALNVSLFAFSGWYMLVFLCVSLFSINYPFPLEWMEGQTIDVISRIINGEPFYTEPSIDYVPFIYTPLYYYIAALFAQMMGVDFPPARLLSILSTLGTGVVIYNWICKENRFRADGVVGAGLFFSTYCLSGRWFDVSRLDNLWVLFLISGMFLVYHYRSRWTAIAAAMLLVAAFFTKQSALIAVVPPLLAMYWLDKRRALLCGGLVAFGIVVGVSAFQYATDGWFGFYVFDVPAGHGMERKAIVEFWTLDLAQKIGIVLSLALACIMFMRVENKMKSLWYTALLIGFVGSSYMSRLHWGGWLNVLIPAHVVLVLMAGLSLKYWRDLKNIYVMAFILLLLCVQMTSLLFNPIHLIPTQESSDKGKKFLDEVSKIEGDIFMSEIQFVQTRVGKKSFTFGMAGFDIMRSDLGSKNYVKEALQRDLRWAMENHQFAAVISGRLLKLREKNAYYEFERNIDYPKEYITGAIPYTLTDLYIPKIKQP